jgi:two-component system phosphate regulon sensor histidine kinase PhoR
MTARVITDESLEMLCHSARDPVIAVDQDGRVCLCNPAAETAFSVSTTDILGHPIDEHPALQLLIPLYHQVMKQGGATRERLTLPSGRTYRVQLLITPAADSVAAPDEPVPLDETGSEFPDLMREIVHELKIPIASAKSFIDLTGASGRLNKKQAAFAQRAQLSLAAMLNLVHELLDIAWIESGGELQDDSMDLATLVRHVAAQLEGYAQYRNVEITLDLPPEGCVIQGDERRLQSAISNLVGNAIKYSPNGGPVDVGVMSHDNHVTVRVEDHGIGIAAEHLPYLFQRFYRIHTPETSRIEGTGLGLAIVKTIVEKHSGEVFVESEPGKGSVFGFQLPLR